MIDPVVLLILVWVGVVVQAVLCWYQVILRRRVERCGREALSDMEALMQRWHGVGGDDGGACDA